MVMKGAPFLLLQIQSKTKTGRINPPLTKLPQPPCNLVVRQGICDLRQLGGVGDGSKAMVLLGEAAAGFWRQATAWFPISYGRRSAFTVSRVSASSGFLSVRQRAMRGNRTAMPDLCRPER